MLAVYFLISAVAADQEVGETFCRTVLSVLLEREIGKIRVHAQRFVSALTPELRGIRMDVEVEELGATDGTKGGSPEIRAILNYLCKSVDENVTDEATQHVHKCVQHIKTLPKVRKEYMTLGNYIDYERKDALEEGKEIGRSEGFQQGRSEGIQQGRREMRVLSILE